MPDARGFLGHEPRPCDDPLARAVALRSRLDYLGARRAANEAVRDRVYDPADPRSGDVLVLLGQLEEDVGDPAAAEAAYQSAVTGAAALELHSRYRVVAVASARLVSVLRDRGALADAARALTAALTVAETHLAGGPEHVEVVAEQGLHLAHLGKLSQALDAAATARTMAAGAPSAREWDQAQVRSLAALGTVLRLGGRYAEALPVLQEALTAAETGFGTGSLEAGNALNDLGICCKFAGWFDQGIAHYRASLAISEATVGLDHPNVATTFHNLGGILHAQGDFVAAEPWARRAVELRERLVGPDHPAVAADRAALAAVLSALKRYDEAELLLREALTCLEANFGPDNHDVIANYGNLAALSRRRGDLEGADRIYRTALVAKERVLGPEHPEVAITLNNLAVVCRARGLLDEAEELYRWAIAILDATVEPEHRALTASRDNLRRLLDARSKAQGTPQRGALEPGAHESHN